MRIFLILILFVVGLSADEGFKPKEVLKTFQPIVVDGKLSEEIWKNSFQVELNKRVKSSRYEKKYPLQEVDNGRAWLTFDEENLYVAFESEVKGDKGPYIREPSSKWEDYGKTVLASDNVCVVLDLGHHGLYDYLLFYVNPKGLLYATSSWPLHMMSQEDLTTKMFPEVHQLFHFESAATIGEGKWFAEIKIPFKDILRSLKKGMIDTLGVNFRKVQWSEGMQGKIDTTQIWCQTMKSNQVEHFCCMASWQPFPSYDIYGDYGRFWANIAYPDEFELVRLPGFRKADIIKGGVAMEHLALTYMKLKLVDFDKKWRMKRKEDQITNEQVYVPTVICEGNPKKTDVSSFISEPKLEKTNDGVNVYFELKSQSDVSLVVVDDNERVVKNLCFGVLGDRSPVPFQKGLRQKIYWDYTDLTGKRVSSGKYFVKVQLGLQAEYRGKLSFKQNPEDSPKWPAFLDTDNLPNAKVDVKKKHDHGGGGGRIPSLDIARNEIYLPNFTVGSKGGGYSSFKVYDAVSMEFKRDYRFKAMTYGVALVASGELAFHPNGSLIVSGFNHIYKTDIMGKVQGFSSNNKPFIPNIWRAHSNPHRGHTIDKDGNIYYIHHLAGHGNLNSLVSKFNAEGDLLQYGLIHLEGISAAGIKVDSEGNIYLGCSLSTKDFDIPEDFNEMEQVDKDIYKLLYGSVVKFGPSGGYLEWLKESEKSDVVANKRSKGYGRLPIRIYGAQWVLPGYSNIVTRARGSTPVKCACQNARFDLDDAGRLWVPDAIGGRVKIADLNGNVVGYIGKRGDGGEENLEFKWPSTVLSNGSQIHIQDYLLHSNTQLNLKFNKEMKLALEVE